MKSASAFLFLSALSTVYAHGFVDRVTIGGVDFKGGDLGSSSTDGVVRIISSNEPVKGAFNADINCGHDAKAVSEIANGMPGDVMAFSWNSGSGNWPHNTGPMITYMASCTNGDCTTFDTTEANWFKIDEQGFDQSTNAWVQQTVMNGEPAYATIPKNLAAGQYMVRHEIIALHLAQSDGGAEFYPSCIQLEVGGSKTGKASSSDKVKFPGGYSDTDAGILVNAFSSEGTNDYVFPGPDVASLASGSASSSGSNDDDSSASATASSSAPASTSTSTNNSSSSGACKLKKIKKRTAQLNGIQFEKRIDTLNRPRHVSRVMRGLGMSST